ncbi:hypothetical protein M9Y10_014097 [Tritrichomonas musculus]|uniref:Uncharacterized protein n=1 Tax=Tritrichomonas musculus TaxID=1915356 RepID=A0ABR2KZ61_9EUKA
MQYKNDYNRAKTELTYKYNIEHYQKTFQESYWEGKEQPKDITLEQMQSVNNDIEILMSNYDDYKRDDELTGKITEYNAYSGEPDQSKLSLVKTFKKEKARAKVFLEHSTWLGKIRSLGGSEEAENQQPNLQGINRLREIYEDKTKDDNSFNSQTFKDKLDYYNNLHMTDKSVKDMKDLHKTYIEAVTFLDVDKLKTELEVEYRLNTVDINKMNANTNAQTLVLELDTIISNTTSDIELQQFHYILKRDFEATLESLKELIIQDQYNIQKLYFTILSKLWTYKTKKQVQMGEKESFQTINERLSRQLKSYDERKDKFQSDSELRDRLAKTYGEIKLEDLWTKYINSTNCVDDDLQEAKVYVQNYINKKTYFDLCNDLGIKIDDKIMEAKTEKEKNQFYTQQQKEIDELKEKWNYIGNEQAIKNQRIPANERIHSWIALYKKYNGDDKKADEELKLENRKYNFNKEFGYEYTSLTRNNQEQIKWLEKVVEDYRNYYKNNDQFIKTYNLWKKTFSTSETKRDDFVDEYGDDVDKCINQ